MKELLVDLLAYSKFSSNREEFSQTDMNAVLQEACAVIAKELEDTGARLMVPPLPVIKANTSLMVELLKTLSGTH